MLKKNTRYPRSSLFLRGVMGPVYQTATKDSETPSAKVVFLDSTSGVTEARSGDISGKKKIGDYLGETLDAYSNYERLTVFHLCSLHLSWSSTAWTVKLKPLAPAPAITHGPDTGFAKFGRERQESTPPSKGLTVVRSHLGAQAPLLLINLHQMSLPSLNKLHQLRF